MSTYFDGRRSRAKDKFSDCVRLSSTISVEAIADAKQSRSSTDIDCHRRCVPSMSIGDSRIFLLLGFWFHVDWHFHAFIITDSIVPVYVAYNGNWEMEDRSWVYKDAENQVIPVEKNVTYEQLKAILYGELELDSSVYEIKLEVRYECCNDPDLIVGLKPWFVALMALIVN